MIISNMIESINQMVIISSVNRSPSSDRINMFHVTREGKINSVINVTIVVKCVKNCLNEHLPFVNHGVELSVPLE